MTKPEAIKLRDEIKASGVHCVIPRGGLLPVIFTTWGQIHFERREQWLEYLKEKERRDEERAKQEVARLNPPRSPIEAMIDAACFLR